MDRRGYLALAGTSLLAGVAGCLGRDVVSSVDGTDAPPDSESATTAGADADGSQGSGTAGVRATPADNVRIDVSNPSTEEVTVRLELSTGGETVLAEDVEVPAEGRTSVDPGIDETGEYELVVSVNSGPREAFPFPVDDYALRNGSDLIVRIEGDRVRIMMEE